MDRTTATRVMLEVHTRGKGVCGVFTYRDRRNEGCAGDNLRPRAPAPAAVHDGRGLTNVLSSELEICLNEAFQSAREARHEFMTVEHLLLAIIDTAEGPRDPARLRRRRRAAAQGTQGIHRPDDPAAQAGRRARGSADARFPARAAACRLPRPVERQEGSLGLERAGRDLQREALARRLPARAAGHRAARRRQLHHPRPGEARRGARGPRRGCAAGRRRARVRGQLGAGEVRHQPEQAGAGRPHRPADRAPARDRADDRDPVPAPQEQPALRRRGRRRQDRTRRRPRAA